MEVGLENLAFLLTGVWFIAFAVAILYSIAAFFLRDTKPELRRPLSVIALVAAIVTVVSARILANYRSDYYGASPVPANDAVFWLTFASVLVSFGVVAIFAKTFQYIWRGGEQG